MYYSGLVARYGGLISEITDHISDSIKSTYAA